MLTSGVQISNQIYLGNDAGALCNSTIPTEFDTANNGSPAPAIYCLRVVNNGTTTLANTVVTDPELNFTYTIPGKLRFVYIS
jgi:hypothetical protein